MIIDHHFLSPRPWKWCYRIGHHWRWRKIDFIIAIVVIIDSGFLAIQSSGWFHQSMMDGRSIGEILWYRNWKNFADPVITSPFFLLSCQGLSWRNFGAISPSSALLLGSKNNYKNNNNKNGGDEKEEIRVRFLPAPNFHGVVFFKFRAWDIARYDLHGCVKKFFSLVSSHCGFKIGT